MDALAKSIVESIDSAFSNYGETVSQVIFNYYKVKYGFSKRDVVTNPKEFEDALENIFGTGSACLMIKRSINKELAHKFKLPKDVLSISSAIRRILENADYS
jgi:hypothetical protein